MYTFSINKSRNANNQRWAVPSGLFLLFVFAGCGKQQPVAPKVTPIPSTPPVTAQPAPAAPATPGTSAAPAGQSTMANGDTRAPDYVDPIVDTKVRNLAKRTMKLASQSTNAEAYSDFQARHQEWNRALIRSALESSTAVDSSQRNYGMKLVEVSTLWELTETDLATATELHRQASEEGQNPILDMEYALVQVKTAKMMIEPDLCRKIWELMSRSWQALPSDTSPLLKLRYLANQQAFQARCMELTLHRPMGISSKAEAEKVLPAVLQAPIPEAEQRFVFPSLRQAAAGTYAKGKKYEPIPEAEANRWLKLMARAASIPSQGFTRQQPGDAKVRRACLLAAWSMHPEWPEAATEMISTVHAIGSNHGEPPRFWFDEATVAQFDYLPAYEAYLETLPNPAGMAAVIAKKMGVRDTSPVGPAKAGDPYLDFAIECLDSGRPETQVPSFIIKQLDLRTVFGSPYEARLRDAMTAYMASPTINSEQRRRYQSHLVMLDWRSGQFEATQKRIAEMGSDIDVFAFNDAGASIAQVMEECSARGKVSPSSQPDSWHTSTWRHILNVGRTPTAIRFSPNGRQMVVGTSNGQLKIWDTEKWTNVSLEGEHWIRSMEISGDGKTLATISEDFGYDSKGRTKLNGGGIVLWDISTGQVKTRLTHQAESSNQLVNLSGWAVAISEDGKFLYSGHSMWAGEPATQQCCHVESHDVADLECLERVKSRCQSIGFDK